MIVDNDLILSICGRSEGWLSRVKSGEFDSKLARLARLLSNLGELLRIDVFSKEEMLSSAEFVSERCKNTELNIFAGKIRMSAEYVQQLQAGYFNKDGDDDGVSGTLEEKSEMGLTGDFYRNTFLKNSDDSLESLFLDPLFLKFCMFVIKRFDYPDAKKLASFWYNMSSQLQQSISTARKSKPKRGEARR